MKRRTVRLMVFSGAGLAGLIAVAQAHYGRDAASQQPANGAGRANAMTARNNQPVPQMAVSELTASDADRVVEPTAAAAPDVVVPATSGSPTRLTPEMGLPGRYRPESSLPPNEADVAAIGPPARLANRVTAATPIVDLVSANGLADANSEPAGRQLLAMTDGDAAPAAVGSRYESAAPTVSDRREPAVPAGLPPAAQGTAASADTIGRLPARPRDRTMQPDRPAVEPERSSDPAEPRVAPPAVPPPMGPDATGGGVPMPTAAPKAKRRAENDPFQTSESMPAVGSPTTLSAATPPGQGNAPLESVPEGTGLPGAGDLEGPQAPSLVLEKRAAAEIQVGKECTFEIHVRNTGQVPAHGVVVRDEIPQKTRLVTCQPRAAESAGGQLRWDLGTLNVGEEAAIKMHLLPVAEGEVGSVATVEFQSRASVRSVVTKPELAVRMSGPHKVMVGDDVPIKIEISNPGSGAATGVILLEDVPAGLSHPAGERLELELGTIPAGQQRQLQLVMTAKQAGVIINLLTARADANLSVEAKVELEVIAPQLKIAIDGPKRRFLDRPATYTLSLENPGTAAAKDVELAAYLPKGMEFVEANNHGQYDATTHSVVWGLEELPAHERGNVQLVALPVEAGDQMLRAEGRAAQGLIDQAQRDISVEGVAAIKFEVVDLEDPVEVGGETNYEIRVVNQGSKAATQVQIVVLVPPDMKAISASGPTQHAMQADRVVFAPLRRLAPKADTTFQVKVQGLGAGDHRLKVQLVTDEIRTPVTKEESTRVYADE